MFVIKFKRMYPDAQIPARQSEGAAGFDLHTASDICVPVGDRVMVSTGIQIAIPKKHVGLIRDRSGEAAKFGIHVLAGVIDEDYRGELKVILQNLGELPRTYSPGDRIAQLVVIPYFANAMEVDDLDATDRGEQGFGSTGL